MLTDAGAADVPLHGLTPLRVTNSKQTVQMDAAQLAKLSMLVCFYMTSMDAMSIERVRACPLLPPKHLYQDVPMQTEGYLCHTCAL